MSDATVLPARQGANEVGMARTDYKGAPSTLCQGCGHNSIAAQIVSACYEMFPGQAEKLIKAAHTDGLPLTAKWIKGTILSYEESRK